MAPQDARLNLDARVLGLPPRMPEARCAAIDVDPDWWFNENYYDRARYTDEQRLAIKICRSCEECHACLKWALENNEPFGIWGGMRARERQAVRRFKDDREQG